jgi:hypothetical protein
MKSRFDVLNSPAARSLARLAALAAVSMTLSGNASAQEDSVRSAAGTQTAQVRLADLEHSFWVCDYLAALHGVTEGLTVHCVAIYDELKGRKFGGDFDGLLSWWQQNKPARHASLGALESSWQPTPNRPLDDVAAATRP